MRSLTRVVVAGALSVPLAFTGAGLAVAGGGHHSEEVCTDYSCNWYWDHDHTFVSDDDQSTINLGIMG